LLTYSSKPTLFRLRPGRSPGKTLNSNILQAPTTSNWTGCFGWERPLNPAQVVAATPLNGRDRAGPTPLNSAGPVDTGTLKFPVTQRRYSQQLLRFSLANSKYSTHNKVH